MNLVVGGDKRLASTTSINVLWMSQLGFKNPVLFLILKNQLLFLPLYPNILVRGGWVNNTNEAHIRFWIHTSYCENYFHISLYKNITKKKGTFLTPKKVSFPDYSVPSHILRISDFFFSSLHVKNDQTHKMPATVIHIFPYCPKQQRTDTVHLKLVPHRVFALKSSNGCLMHTYTTALTRQFITHITW